MTFSTKTSPFNTTAFAIGTMAFIALHASMLMGFDKLASNGHHGMNASTQVAKTQTAPRTVALDRVVISSRRA